MIKNINAQQATELLNSNDTFIINIVASWCSDCTDQSEHFNAFKNTFSSKNIPIYQVNVQKTKNEYISSVDEKITMQLGGRGFPRTALIKNGKIVDADNVEVISEIELDVLANKFLLLL